VSCVCHSRRNSIPKTTWKIYEIQHRRSPDSALTTRYQFTDGKGKRRHCATKAKAKLEAAKDRALYHHEGRLAAGLTDEQRRDAASAVKHLPLGWTLTRAAKFATEHVSRIKITLTIDQAVKRFLTSREHRSDMHYEDLNRRLNRWLVGIESGRDIATVEKIEIERYLTQYVNRNRLNHLRALTNFFRFSAKIGAIGEVPTADIDISFRRSNVSYLDSRTFADLLTKAADQQEADILAWLVLSGFLGPPSFRSLSRELVGREVGNLRIPCGGRVVKNTPIDRFGGSHGLRDRLQLEGAVFHPRNVYYYAQGTFLTLLQLTLFTSRKRRRFSTEISGRRSQPR
jgi:hypothetical protein